MALRLEDVRQLMEMILPRIRAQHAVLDVAVLHTLILNEAREILGDTLSDPSDFPRLVLDWGGPVKNTLMAVAITSTGDMRKREYRRADPLEAFEHLPSALRLLLTFVSVPNQPISREELERRAKIYSPDFFTALERVNGLGVLDADENRRIFTLRVSSVLNRTELMLK